MKHPLHPALVHFPVACWSLATACDLAGLAGVPAWNYARLLLAVGCLAATAAAITGFVELMKIEEGSVADRDGHRHMLLMLASFGCYAASWFLRLRSGSAVPPGVPAIASGLAGFALLAVGGWLGGKLVYHHGVGRVRPGDR